MKKNGILTLLFACIPGAGQMYQGYMKRGLSLITMFCLFIILGSTTGLDALVVGCIVVSYLMVTAFCHSVRAVLWSTKSRRDGTGVSDRRLSDLYRAALWTVLRSRKYQTGGKSGR